MAVTRISGAEILTPGRDDDRVGRRFPLRSFYAATFAVGMLVGMWIALIWIS